MVAQQEESGVNMYPHKFEVTISIPQFVSTYTDATTGTQFKETSLSIAGRVMNMRSMSAKLRFYDLQADGQKVQVVANMRYLSIKYLFTNLF